jgi:hypothetical protein
MADPKTNQLSVLVPDQLRAALNFAAERRYTTPSEYCRQAVIERMRADGVEPTLVQPVA